MAGTFNKDLTDVSSADATTNWLYPGAAWAMGVNTNSPSADFVLQGSGCLIGRSSATTGPVTVQNWALALASPALDLTDGRHIFMWVKIMSWPAFDTLANGGLRIVLSSDATPTVSGTAPNVVPTNSAQWKVGGKDLDTVEGWVCYVIDPQSTPDVSTGTPVLTSVDRIGMGTCVTAVVGGGSFKPNNLCIDAVRVGTKLTIKDGTSGSPVALADIYGYDMTSTNCYGILTKQGGIYFGAGKLAIGDAAQTAITYFKDTDQTLVFQNFPVAATFYEIVLAGAGSYLTTFMLGNYSGGLTSGGCTIKGATSANIWTLSAGASNVAAKVYGSVFAQMKSATLNSGAEMRDVTVQRSGTITPVGATIDSCTFRDLITAAPISATYAIDVATSAPYITNCRFVNCNRAVRWNVNADTDGRLDGTTFIAGTAGNALELGSSCPSEINLTNVTFSGYGADGAATAAIRNSSGHAVTVNILGTGSTPTYINEGGGSSTSIVSGQKTLTLTGLIAGSDIVILEAGTETELANIDQNPDSDYGYTYTYSAGVYIDVGVFKAGYVPFYVRTYLLPSTGGSLPIAQDIDRNYTP